MSKEFKVLYHGCGACYYDGTLLTISKQGACSRPNEHPFWKNPEDIVNTVRTRLQHKEKNVALPSYVEAYHDYIQMEIEKELAQPLLISDNEKSD